MFGTERQGSGQLPEQNFDRRKGAHRRAGRLFRKAFEKQEKRSSINNEIAKKLNLYRKLTTYEEEDIVKWTENYGYNMDIIEIALKKASSNNRVRFDYIDTLLTDWHNKDLHTETEVNTYLQSIKDKEKKSKQIEKVAFEYTQSTFDNLESLYDN